MSPKSSKPSAISAAELTRQIRQFCQSNADSAIVKKYARFFREGYDAYGLDSKCYDTCIKELTENYNITLKLVLEAAPDLIKTGKYEETIFPIIMLKRLYPELTAKTFKELEKWFKVGIGNWAHADILAGDIFGYLLQKGVVQLEDFDDWRTAKNKYQRRTAAVSLIKPMKESKSVKNLLSFVEPLMMDEAREVQQGVGWFLREAWVIDKPKTEKFLLKWKDKSPRLIYQYATEKMPAGEKARFKKAK